MNRKYSRVVEVDPATGQIVWQYHAPIKSEFFSPTKGSAQRLANGNTLICNADHGQAFEVTREGEVVWEWWSAIVEERSWLRDFQERICEPPYRTVIYRMLRISPESLARLKRPALAGDKLEGDEITRSAAQNLADAIISR